MTTTIWIGSIRRQRSALDRSDLRLLAWGSSGVALGLRDWSVVVFRFALENFFFFFFFYKALSDFWFRSDFWFSDLLCIGVFFFFFFWRIRGYLCNLLIVGLAVGFVGGLSWAWLCYKFFFFFSDFKIFFGAFFVFFFFFFLKLKQINFYLFIWGCS